MPVRPLYAISADLLHLNDILEEIDGDLSRLGEMEPAVTGWLELLGEEQATKLDNYLHLIKQLQMEATAAKAEEEQWAAKRKARESRARYLETKLLRHLEATGQAKVTTASGRVVSVQKNGGVAPLIINEHLYSPDDEGIPSDCIRIKREFDKASIRVRLDEGGVGLPVGFAELGQRGTSLRVK